jgi:hypothetical protein
MRRMIANLCWVASNLAEARRFSRAVGRCRQEQAERLRQILRKNASTEYGRRFGFDRIDDADAYRERVPLVTYDDLRPWIERAADGVAGVLTAEPVSLFEPSSGSAAASKLIPYTASLRAEFSRAIAPWIVDLYRRRPTLLGGPAYWSISPLAARTRTRGGIPVGFEEDSAYLGGLHKRLVDRILAVPGSVRHCAEVDEFRRQTVLHLLRAQDLRLISVWNPTFLTMLAEFMHENWDWLLADLHRDAPARARTLSRSGPLAAWPRLALVSCWTDAHAAPLLHDLARHFPGVEIQGKGLIATEGFVSLPLGVDRVLAVRSHFFEFLDDAGRCHLAHEVEVGREYEVVLTTSGGLYRYRLQDRVRIIGKRQETPSLLFLGKTDRISDLRGEKLTEAFAAAAVEEALAGACPRHLRLLARSDGRRAWYDLELAIDVPLPDFSARLDTALRRSFHYDLCRRLGQLEAARLVPTRPPSALARLQRPDIRLGDVKPQLLVPLA